MFQNEIKTDPFVSYRGNVMAEDCPSREILKSLTGRWALLVLVALIHERQRFGDLHKRIGGISERMLSQTLRKLETDGMLKKFTFEEVPPRVEYELTPLGSQAAYRMKELVDWLEGNLPEIVESQGS